MKKRHIISFLSTILYFLPIMNVFGQTEGLILKLSRDFGYGGFNNDIQGLFSMRVTGPADLVRVVFYLDTTLMGEINQAPYNLQFNTDDYPLGQHELYAVGYSSTGSEFRSNTITSIFVPAAEGNKVVMQIIIPVLVIVLAAILLSFAIPLISGRRKKQLPLGAERSYGLGGGICPKCQRPFALPLFSLNLGLSKLARCPYCGKWSAVRLQTIVKLRQAEQAELEWGGEELKVTTEEEKLQKELDDSKYQG